VYVWWWRGGGGGGGGRAARACAWLATSAGLKGQKQRHTAASAACTGVQRGSAADAHPPAQIMELEAQSRSGALSSHCRSGM
jgi:hypothetical protein